MELLPNAGNALLMAVNGLRLVCTLIWLVVTITYTRIMLRRKVFHANVQCLLIVLPFSYGIILIPNTMVQSSIRFKVGMANETTVTLNEITDIGLFGTAFNLFGFVFERLIATLLVRRYEFISARIPFISLSVIAVQWAMAVAFIAAYYADWITLLPNLIVVGVEWAISVVMFSALPTISRRSYDRAMRNSTLRYRNRYQSIENIRTALVLNRLVWFLSTAIIFLLSYYTVMHYWTPDHYFPPMNHFFHAMSAILGPICCIIVLSNHDTLKSDLRQLLCIKIRNRPKVSEQTITTSTIQQHEIRSISGISLNVPIEGHHEHYFANYSKQWA